MQHPDAERRVRVLMRFRPFVRDAVGVGMQVDVPLTIMHMFVRVDFERLA
jgi:hypothetical protein